jgi:hypothetical protein
MLISGQARRVGGVSDFGAVYANIQLWGSVMTTKSQATIEDLYKVPGDGKAEGVIVNGKAIDSFDARKAIVSEFPAEVVLQYGVIAETDPALEKPGPTSPKSKTVLSHVPGASLKTDG